MANTAFSALLPSVLRIIDGCSLRGVHAADADSALPWHAPFASEQDVERMLDVLDRLLLLLCVAGYGVPEVVLDAGGMAPADLLSVSLPSMALRAGTTQDWTQHEGARVGLRVCPTMDTPIDLSAALAAYAPGFGPGARGWLLLPVPADDPATALDALVRDTLWPALASPVAAGISALVEHAAGYQIASTEAASTSLADLVAQGRARCDAVGTTAVLQAEYQAEDGGPGLADQIAATTGTSAGLLGRLKARDMVATTAESLWNYWWTDGTGFGGGASGGGGAGSSWEGSEDPLDGLAVGAVDRLGLLRAVLCWVGTTDVVDAERQEVFTVCFSGTACTRDEGEATRPESDKRIYCTTTGYIPMRLHLEISRSLNAMAPSVTVRGVGENDWALPRNDSEALLLDAPLKVPDAMVKDLRKYSGGDQKSDASLITGWTATALALHGANLAAASGAQQFNFIGHSRGAVESIMAAWFLYAYGPGDIPVNIFAIDPVPGTGQWYGIITQLPPNVVNYVGVYAWDHLDQVFQVLVPRPNGRMTGVAGPLQLGGTWDTLADGCQLADPLAPGDAAQPQNYALYACRGRHSTVAGNTTADGQYDPANLSTSVAPVPELIYRIARAYLTQWGTTFVLRGAVGENVTELRRKIHTDHSRFDAMGGGETRTSDYLPNRPLVRRVSSISGRTPWNNYYFDDVVGDPPYTLAFPVTIDRKNKGWVNWNFL